MYVYVYLSACMCVVCVESSTAKLDEFGEIVPLKIK